MMPFSSPWKTSSGLFLASVPELLTGDLARARPRTETGLTGFFVKVLLLSNFKRGGAGDCLFASSGARARLLSGVDVDIVGTGRSRADERSDGMRVKNAE